MTKCECCNHPVLNEIILEPDLSIKACEKCMGLHGVGNCVDLCTFVNIKDMQEAIPKEKNYFHFLVRERGVDQMYIHGWYDVDTKNVIQFG